VTRPVLLDASFLIDLDRETARGEVGPARRFLPQLRRRTLAVSVITVEEMLEGARDDAATIAALQRFAVQGLHLAHAAQCARVQRKSTRRLGENDAWLVATARVLDADIVGADRPAYARLGERYLRYR
jgi:predicted nucleic acid-binding protein